MGGCSQTFSKWPLLQFLFDSYESRTHHLCANTKVPNFPLKIFGE